MIAGATGNAPVSPVIAGGEDPAEEERRKLALAYSSPAPTSADVVGYPGSDPSNPATTAMTPPALPEFTETNPQPPALDPAALAAAAAGGKRTTKTTDSSTTTSHQVQSAREMMAQAGAENALEERKGANMEVAGIKQNVAEKAAEGAQEVAGLQAQKEQHTQQLMADREAAYQRGQVEEKKLYDEYQKKGTEEVLPDGLGTRLLAALAQGLGAYGASMNGGPNSAADIIKERTRQTYQAHKDKIEQARQLYLDRHGANVAAEAHFDQMERNLNTRFAAGLDKLAAKSTALQLKAGIPLDKAQASASNAAITQESAEFKAKNEQSLRSTVSKTVNSRSVTVSGAGVGGTDGSGKGMNGMVVARDENNNARGMLPKMQLGKFTTRDADFQRAAEQLEHLKEDIKTNDYAMSPGSRERRNALASSALAAVATISPLGKTNEAIEIEKKNLGDPNGLLGGTRKQVMANIDRKIEEVKKQRQLYANEILQPLPGAENIRQDYSSQRAAAPQEDHQGALEWLKTEGKKPENRATAAQVMKKLQASGAIQVQ